MASVLADPAVPAAVKDKLRLAEEVRAFAFGVMGLPRSTSYTRFAALDRPYVSIIVTACPKTRLAAYTWWFPLVGRVPYKGYFDAKRARREAARLSARGYDTDVQAVVAYSSLGWRSDPLVSPMLDGSEGLLAETIIHELAHSAFWFKGDADFNESAADFFGEEGAEDFLARRFGAGSPQERAYERELAREAAFDGSLAPFDAELSRLYAQRLPEAETLRRREAVFASAKAALGLSAFNNAVLLDLRRYRGGLDLLSRARAKLGGDWPRTLALVRGLDPRRPEAALKAFVEGTPSGAPHGML